MSSDTEDSNDLGSRTPKEGIVSEAFKQHFKGQGKASEEME